MGSSKKQTVGYKYHLGMHQILCHGPVDKMTRFTIDEKIAWGGTATGGPISVNLPTLFGGEGREGGVVGTMDVEMGGPDQGQNSYLLSKLGSPLPSFRGVVGVVMRQMYLGNNPYLKKNSFRLQRVHVRQDGVEQWYDEKAAIPSIVIPASKALWRYLVVSNSDNTNRASPSYDDSSWATGYAPFADKPWSLPEVYGFSGVPATVVPQSMKVWMRSSISLDEVPANFRFEAFVDNDCIVYVNGVQALQVGGNNGAYYDENISGSFFQKGVNSIAVVGWDRHSGARNWFWFDWRLSGGAEFDLNPVHIIRECLTDPVWGMGYNEGDIDDDSFMAAADTLYDEGMGMSLLWDRQMPIEQFIQEVLKHINAALYVGRYGPTAGKFVLRLIRGDYDIGDLLVFDESSIEKIENFKRVETGELVNSVTVNYWDAKTGKTASTTAQDPALVQQQGAVINTTMQYPGFTNQSIADRVALRDLNSLSTPLASCVLYLKPKDDPTDERPDPNLLNIGDVIAVNWDDYGLVLLPVRITALTFGDGKTHRVKATVTQDVFTMPLLGMVVPPDAGWEDPSQEPIPMERQYAEEVTYFELVQQFGQSVVDTQLASEPDMGMVGSAGSRAQSGATNARFLTNGGGADYEDVGAIDFSPSALLDGDVGFPSGDTTEIWTIKDLVDSGAIEIGGYAKINDELVVVVGLDGTSLEVKRAALDTVPQEHPSDSVVFFSDPFVQVDSTEYVASDEVSVKLLPVTGKGTLDESAATALDVVLGSRAIRPYPPGNVQINGEYYPLSVIGAPTITWAHRSRPQQTGGEMVGFTDGDVGPEPGVTYTVLNYNEDTDALLFSESGITGTSCDVTTVARNNRLELFSERDGYESFQRHVIRFISGFTIEASLPPAIPGVAYSGTLTAVGATPPVIWSVVGGALPDGLSLGTPSGNSVEIIGTPTGSGSTFTIEAEDANGTTESTELEITVGASWLEAYFAASGDPIFAFEFDNDITDSSGNGYNGSWVGTGSIIYTEDDPSPAGGFSVNLTGSRGANINTNAIVTGGDSFTVVGIVKVPSNGFGNNILWMGGKDPGTGTSRIAASISFWGSGTAPRIAVDFARSNINYPIDPALVGQWMTVIVEYDQPTQTVSVYVAGAGDTEFTLAGQNSAVPISLQTSRNALFEWSGIRRFIGACAFVGKKRGGVHRGGA